MADHVAGRAAASCQLPAATITLRADESALVSRVIERQVNIAVKLSLTGVSRFTRPVVAPKAFNKVKPVGSGGRPHP